MEDVNLPNTDSPEVMAQAISLQLTYLIWEQASRAFAADETEEAILALYQRVRQVVERSLESK